MIKVCYIKSQVTTGVEYHRIEIPFNHLNQHYDLDIKGCDGFNLDFMPDQFDVIVLNRVRKQAKDYIKIAKERGVKIVLDLDDWIEWPDWHLNRDRFDTPIIEAEIKHMIELADVIWCGSEYLMNSLKTAKAIYIPNAIDFEQPQFQPQPQEKKGYTIGYVAGANHHLDCERLFKPLDILRQKSKDYNILVGGVAKDATSSDYWNYILNIFTSNGLLPKERLYKIEALDPYNYAVQYNYIDCLLAPLNNDQYSKCKSNIKVLEAGAFGLPIICSNVEPYKEFINKGLVYELGSKVDDLMLSLIKSPGKGKKMGKALHEYVKENYNINKINELRYNSISNLFN